ncbi:MAG: NFACT RNA binding domain-containing protein [Bacillota bacterium]|nr:NFACT RNA binding domain-containing protein [Bacillota bacterium]
MALDGIFLHSLVDEISDVLVGGRVSKVNQPEKDEIILLVRGSNNVNYKLLISASSSYPKIHFTKESKANPLKAPMFCMVLRKYLNNSRIINIHQLQTDRIVMIDFESVDELGFNSIYTLIVEIMGRHSNITLVRQRDDIIMDSIKHITPDINRYRSLMPNIKFVYPPSSERLEPFNFIENDFISFIKNNTIELNEKAFSKIFVGVSANLSKELFWRLNNYNLIADKLNFTEIYNKIKSIFDDIKNNNYYFASYTKNNNLIDFYCIKLSYLTDSEEKVYTSPSILLEDFYYEKDKLDRLNNRSNDLQKIISINLDRCNKKIQILEDKLKECADKEYLKICGELLTANIYSVKKGDTEISVYNYYSENGDNMTIPLNEHKTPSENIQSYFKKYNKLKKSEEMATIQLDSTKDEIEYLQSVLTNIQNADKYEEIEEIKKELIDTGYIKYGKSSKKGKKDKPTKPLHFKSSDDIDIYVGKNNLQNDFLTLKFADKRDIWMHTKNIPGSHVIVKNMNGKIPDSTLLEAAALAAFYSKAKNSSNVPVDYTEVKNVKKPSGAKPGMVIYTTNKTILTEPKTL